MRKAAVRTRSRPSSENLSTPPSATPNTALLWPGLELAIQYVPTGSLQPPPRALRQHSAQQLQVLKASVAEFGIVKPIVIDEDDTIIAGYGVWLATQELRYTTVPIVRLAHLTPVQVRLLRMGDNQIATLSVYDDDLLRLELGELAELDLKLNLKLDFEVTGFPTGQIDDIRLGAGATEEAGPVDMAPQEVAISQLGDLWLLGENRILCGNSLEEASFETLLGEERAQMIVSDNPYNCKIKGNVSSRKNAQEFQFASGEMTSEEFITFLMTVFRLLVQFSIDGSIHYQFIDWRSSFELMAAGRAEYTELKNMLVWDKGHGSRGFYRSQHELIYCYKRGKAPHICTFAIEKGARVRTNVLKYPGCNSFGRARKSNLAAHVTTKNFSLIADLIRDCSETGGIILDPFGGSGQTLLASQWTGRAGTPGRD